MPDRPSGPVKCLGLATRPTHAHDFPDLLVSLAEAESGATCLDCARNPVAGPKGAESAPAAALNYACDPPVKNDFDPGPDCVTAWCAPPVPVQAQRQEVRFPARLIVTHQAQLAGALRFENPDDRGLRRGPSR